MPYLKRFRNDWATEEIIKQYFKNKHKHHYKNGWLTPSSRYDHLKDNSAKRSTDGSRVKRAKVIQAAKKNARCNRDGRHEREVDEENNNMEGVEDD